MANGDEGLEDLNDDNTQDDIEALPNQYALEIICRNMGTRLAAEMLLSEKETPSQFYTSARNEAARQYRHPKEAMRSIDNFAIDSYRFHKYHKEQELREAIRNTYVDTFGYMMAVANGEPLKPGRLMKDDWW